MSECRCETRGDNTKVLICAHVKAVSPVSVDVGDAEGVAVVQQRGVNECVVFGVFHQSFKVAQVTVATTDTVSSAVLI